MKRTVLKSLLFTLLSTLLITACKKNDSESPTELSEQEIKDLSEIPFDSTLVAPFFIKHPQLEKYHKDVTKLYAKQDFRFMWYDRNGINEFANILYNKINNFYIILDFVFLFHEKYF